MFDNYLVVNLWYVKGNVMPGPMLCRSIKNVKFCSRGSRNLHKSTQRSLKIDVLIFATLRDCV